MNKIQITYQSKVTSPDITRWHSESDYNPDTVGVPLVGGSDGINLMMQSSGCYRNGTAEDYRWAQATRQTWWNDAFDFDTQMAFEVQRFDAQFGEHYTTHDTNLPSYDESRLIYGR